MPNTNPNSMEIKTPRESLFQTLQYQAFRKGLTARTAESREWFRKKIKEMGEIDRRRLLKDDAVAPRNEPIVGSMFMYFYDPKHKETLPYYDRFPLIFMVDSAPGGFYGINLHYLSYMMRAKLFDKLLETKNNKKYDESTQLRINYGILKSTQSLNAFKPCFKHYLTDHLRSRPVQIYAPEWEIALFLPTHDFAKKSAQYVWTKSALGKAF